MSSIDEARKAPYTYVPPIRQEYNSNDLIITVIIDCYYGLNLVKKSIQSVLDQDYSNVELILIDNAAKTDVSRYLSDIHTNNKNVAVIKFEENQFSWDDIGLLVTVCWNSGVLESKGSVISHINYDDMLSTNCCSKMAALFAENDNCVTASPLPVSINLEGKINSELSEIIKMSNKRSRYIDGKKLAIDLITGAPKKLFSAPGHIMFIRKAELIKFGGFDRNTDISQIIKFAIHGDSGFDPKANLFSRHHEGQLSKQIGERGMALCSSLYFVVKSEKIIEMWERLFNNYDVKLLYKFIKINKRAGVKNLSVGLLRNKNIVSFYKLLVATAKECHFLVFYLLLVSFKEVLLMVRDKILDIIKNK